MELETGGEGRWGDESAAAERRAATLHGYHFWDLRKVENKEKKQTRGARKGRGFFQFLARNGACILFDDVSLLSLRMGPTFKYLNNQSKRDTSCQGWVCWSGLEMRSKTRGWRGSSQVRDAVESWPSRFHCANVAVLGFYWALFWAETSDDPAC